MYPTSYHQTTDVPTGQLPVRERLANKQEDYVLQIFLANPNRGFTADEITNMLLDLIWDKIEAMGTRRAISRGITIDKSARRAISNLVAKENLLTKTNKKRSGRSGRENHVYRLSTFAKLKYNLS